MPDSPATGPNLDTEDDEPYDVAQTLYDYATHFAVSDWDYTRRHDIRHIRYPGDWSGYDRPDRRLRRVLRSLFGPRSPLDRLLGIRHRSLADISATIRVGLATRAHLPDGVLDGGSVIAFWEETGEYLQLVQPSVGALIAQWLMAEPDNPHARAVRGELERIQAGYRARIAAGAVE